MSMFVRNGISYVAFKIVSRAYSDVPDVTLNYMIYAYLWQSWVENEHYSVRKLLRLKLGHDELISCFLDPAG